MKSTATNERDEVLSEREGRGTSHAGQGVGFMPPPQHDASQLLHVSVDGLAEWIAWWDGQEASA